MPKTNIILFDIPNTLTPRGPSSPNTWKVRLALNLKQLDFTTQWVVFSEITSVLSASNFKPTGTKADGSPRYTVPAILDLTDPFNPASVSDSTEIIAYLEKTYPTPGINLIPKGTEPLLFFVERYLDMEVFYPAFVALFNTALKNVIPADQAAAYSAGIQKYTGTVPDLLEKREGPEREAAWKKFHDGLGFVDQAYKRSTGEFIVSGESPSLADLRLAALLVWTKTISPDEGWSKISSWHEGRWRRLMEYFEPYAHVDT